MHYTSKIALSTLLSASLLACTSVADNQVSQPKQTNKTVSETTKIIKPQSQQALPSSLTLEQVMADPDWLGRQPERAYWSDDGKNVFYQRKREGQRTRDLWSLGLEQQENGNKVPLSALHSVSYKDAVEDQANAYRAWVFQTNIFVKHMATGDIYQLTQDDKKPSDLVFLNDGRLSYRVGNSFYAIEVSSGRSFLLASWKFSEQPKAVEAAKDYIAEQQHQLIQVVAKKRRQRQEAEDHRNQLIQANATLTRKPFYLSSKHRTVDARLSPNGKWVLVSETKDTPWRDDGDIMPNYIGEDGRLKADKVRRRVADTKPQEQTLWLLDITAGQKHKVSFNDLPGFNEDVLFEEKKENAEAKGETYEANRLPRSIGLISDWYWDQSAIQWNTSGDKVAVMLEAWDNKDRWIATLDTQSKSLTSQHRYHDDAWVNYRNNGFGWLSGENTLYYLSEQSGYSHLYLKPLGGQERALTQGNYEVSSLTLSKDNRYFYYKANQSHPGIYEIYRVDAVSGDTQQLTSLNGMTDYQLSRDEKNLLLTHSKLSQPPELYVQQTENADSSKRITHTLSEAFNAINWVEPQIVPVPSSHTDLPVYARVYLPEGYASGDKNKAVFFSHGAGYLQNVHLGWSTYFREFMFHSFLVQQGYVVMDMDYRASAGYGRDWRTAIYRQMGKPEIEDLQDGVNWLVDNANVDRNRVGHYGGSYGGFITFMAMFNQPELFQAGAALRPVSDWAHYNHGYTSNILNTPDVDPIAYERSSPIYFAEGLQKPLLMNAPMVDSNVFFVDVVRLVQRFIELEKEDFETAIYPVESHGFVQPSSWLDEYRRIYKLFEENL